MHRLLVKSAFIPYNSLNILEYDRQRNFRETQCYNKILKNAFIFLVHLQEMLHLINLTVSERHNIFREIAFTFHSRQTETAKEMIECLFPFQLTFPDEKMSFF